MSLTNIRPAIVLDIYDHNLTPSSIKAIALDSNTRFVDAVIRNRGEIYDIGQDAAVTLTVVRPDKTKVQVTGQTYSLTETTRDEETITYYGARAELTQLALAIKGDLKAQFKITSGTQELRTEIFSINNGEALDAGDGDWAGELDGHDLDEMAQGIEDNAAAITEIQEDLGNVKSGLSAIEDQLDDITDAYVQVSGSTSEESTSLNWVYGNISTQGEIGIVSLPNRLASLNALPDIDLVTIADGYIAFLYAWDNGTYIGRYTTGNTFAKSSGTAKQFTSAIDLTPFVGKELRLVIKKTDDSNFASASDGATAILLNVNKIYIKDVVNAQGTMVANIANLGAEVARLDSEKDDSTDAYVLYNADPSELSWTYGNIDTSGTPSSPTNTKRLTITDFIPTAVTLIGLANGIVAFLYAYDSTTATYLGRYTTDDVFSPQDGTAKQFTSAIDLSEFSNKKFRIVLKKSDESAFASADGSALITLEKRIYVKDIAEKVEEIGTTNTNQYAYIGSPEIYVPSDITDAIIDSMQSSEIYAMYDDLVTNYPKWISRASDIGVDANDNPIRHYIIRMGNACYNSASYPNVSTNNWISNFDNKHILINAGTHGDEKTSVLGVARFAELLLASTDKWAMFIKSNFVLHIIPILNVWGFNNMSRENKDGININRDYADFATTEAQSVRDLCEQLGDNLKVIIDSHNTQSDIGMMGTKPTYTDYLYNIRTATCLASVLTPYLSNHYSADKFPYFYAWESTSGNTLMDFTNINGYIGGTVETPRNYNSGAVNHAETSAMVVGLLANLIPMCGTKDA